METIQTRPQGRVRVEKWDLLRALLIFLVVLGHMVDYYDNSSVRMRGLFLFINFFHMPCFLFLDGLFSKRNVDERRYDHIFSYLVIYFFAKMLICLTEGIATHEFDFSLLEENGFPWYGLALFWCSLLTIFLKRISHKWVLVGAVLLACFVGYDSGIGDTLAIMRTIVFFPFFFAGYCLDPAKVAEKLSGVWAKVCGAAVLAALAAVCFCLTDKIYFVRALLTGRNAFQTFETVYDRGDLVFYGGLFRLGYYAVVALLCVALIALVPNHLPGGNAVAAIGRRSLEIYILHRPLLFVLYNVVQLDKWTAALGIGNWIILPISMLITAFFALPFWERPIRAIIYPKPHRPQKQE
ncbi:MAG: acyltransferase family protein [Clostridiales bacterium]|nr:acyltransferase family protein [Clostridiales bacterium]